MFPLGEDISDISEYDCFNYCVNFLWNWIYSEMAKGSELVQRSSVAQIWHDCCVCGKDGFSDSSQARKLRTVCVHPCISVCAGLELKAWKALMHTCLCVCVRACGCVCVCVCLLRPEGTHFVFLPPFDGADSRALFRAAWLRSSASGSKAAFLSVRYTHTIAQIRPSMIFHSLAWSSHWPAQFLWRLLLLRPHGRNYRFG